MTDRTWIILGASSVIAEQFAHLAAQAGCSLRLVGRNKEQLDLIAKDIQIRFKVACDGLVQDLTKDENGFIDVLRSKNSEIDLFIAHSDFTSNDHLNSHSINRLLTVNIASTVQIIDHYLKLPQSQHKLVYLSSVAACRGRAKNSLYGASKAAVEVYLQGLQQKTSNTQVITIARLGYIDTKQTYGLPGIFYAAPPSECALACWKAVSKGKAFIYFPKFWKWIAAVITHLPFFIYKRMGAI
ncbi:SDR family NAD(P)-dependent oxidoreductase [Legionella waltersii]|uniref:Short chain dehydrogenase/reductase family oxidoreductase n=1 Tax=Legionella waltersii TaxID=66969 RepID=A0A0W1AAS1_9GAMM|nr:SDR family NAD(P)-dependent oxidoreductase [Legionella waltersii]KTD78372.1 short chain dehydrogenase/reductase family oxidoreductase [Legionella waltersii]SNV06399.1 short chain dehydrogenase/reductase family oxidoreductase [Legionella waltersii]